MTGLSPTSGPTGGGTTVTIDTAAVAYSVSVAGTGTLQFEQTTARSLTVGTDVTVQGGGTLRSNPAGTETGHNLIIGGNLTNDDLEVIKGRSEQLVGRIQERYGIERAEAERQVKEWMKLNMKEPSSIR